MLCYRRDIQCNAINGFFCAYRFPKRSEHDKGSGQDNNSIWAIVAGVVKNYNVPFDYVLYEMSISNVHLYNAVLPTYDSETDKKKDKDVIDADDPTNRNKVDDFFNKLNGM